MSEPEAKRQRERSPNYPTFGLPEAIKKMMSIYESERRNPMPLALAAQRLGYSSLSGPARSALSTLKKFGLLVDAGSNQVRVSEDGLAIAVYKEGNQERAAAIQRCALRPELIRETLKEYPDPVSDENLKATLIMRKGFTETAAETFIKAFNATVQLAKLRNLEDNDSESDLEDRDEEQKMAEETGLFGKLLKDPAVLRQLAERATDHEASAEIERELLRFNLSGDRLCKLVFVGQRPTQNEIQQLIDQLTVSKPTFPTESRTVAEPPAANRESSDSASPAPVSDDQKTADTVASVPFFITRAQKTKLRELGHDDAAIAKMRPADAHKILGIS